MENLLNNILNTVHEYKVAYNDEHDIPCTIKVSATTFVGAIAKAKQVRKGTKFRAVRLRDDEYSTYLQTRC